MFAIAAVPSDPVDPKAGVVSSTLSLPKSEQEVAVLGVVAIHEQMLLVGLSATLEELKPG